MNYNSKVLYFSFLFSLIYIAIVSVYTNKTIEIATKQKYLDVSNEMRNKIKTLISEKQEAIKLVSMSLAANDNIKNILLNNEYHKLKLGDFSLSLRKTSSMKNLWFQVVTADGISFYRSWTNKRGDNLIDVREDIAKILTEPKITSTISVGKFDMAFKSMIPIYNQKQFIGVIETIAKFNSIAIKMKEESCETIVVVDKRYKERITQPVTNNFIDGYYISNLEPTKKVLDILKAESIEKFININNFLLDTKNSLLFSVYKQKDIGDENMGYFVMAKDLHTIDMHEIESTKENMQTSFALILLIILVLVYYIYTRQYKRYIEEQNEKLEERVQDKTKELNHLANHDPLTLLPNRLLFLDRLEQHLKYAARREQNVCVLFLDLDRFKEVNDIHGHHVGDELLKSIALRLIDSVREEDTISRLGGDEFTIILHNVSQNDTVAIAKKIQARMQEAFVIENIVLNTTFSIGISTYPQDGVTSEILIRNADTAMYKAKDSGKNNYQFYSAEMTDTALHRVELENDIKLALDMHEFHVFFQPKINALTDKVIGLEALIRWRHPKKGLIFPNDFIPFAEQIGLISKIDTYVMKQAIETVLEWKRKGLDTGVLSLNVSTKQLDDAHYPDEVLNIVQTLGYDCKDLEIEILESQIINNSQNVIEVLENLRKIGVKISLDDFGTGYSSLSYLKHLPVDKLKIDRSFVQDIPKDKADMAIVKTIIALGKNLGLELIVEGVETQEQVDFLREEGCPNIQGYFFSKPLSVRDCELYLKARQ